MAKKELKMAYDRDGDILDVSVGDARAAISQELEDDFFIRIDPSSKEVVGFSILNFEKWFQRKKDTKTLPLEGEFHLRTA